MSNTPVTTPDLLQGSKESASTAVKAAAESTKSIDFRSAKTSDVIRFFGSYENVIASFMPDNLVEAAKRQLVIAAQIIQKNDKLKECDPKTIMGAVLFAATSGLDLSLAQGYLIPYGKECQFQISARGYHALAMRTGLVSTVDYHPVFKGEFFEVTYGDTPKIEHRPDFNKFGSEVVAAYAVATMKDGSKVRSVIGRPQIEHLRTKNKMQGAQPSGAWQSDYAAMAAAKAMKYLCNHYLPLSIEAQSMIENEERTLTMESFKATEVGSGKTEIIIE